MKCPSVLIVEEIEPFLCFVQEEMEAKIKQVDTIFCLLSTYLQNFKIFKIYNLIMGLWEYEKKNFNFIPLGCWITHFFGSSDKMTKLPLVAQASIGLTNGQINSKIPRTSILIKTNIFPNFDEV